MPPDRILIDTLAPAAASDRTTISAAFSIP
jgi:hypothetical protein